MNNPQYRKRASGKIATFIGMAALTLVSTAIPQAAMAVPIKYELSQPGNSPLPGGWFVYDRDASILSDYWITYDQTTYPKADFDYPAVNLISAGQSGFNFSDQTTTFGLGQNFTVYLYGFNVNFVQSALGADALGRPLIGNYLSEIHWSGQYIGGHMYFQGYFAEAGPIEQAAPAPVPEPSTLLLLGSGLGGFAMFVRKFRKG